jgi:hypothetical protein
MRQQHLGRENDEAEAHQAEVQKDSPALRQRQLNAASRRMCALLLLKQSADTPSHSDPRSSRSDSLQAYV